MRPSALLALCASLWLAGCTTGAAGPARTARLKLPAAEVELAWVDGTDDAARVERALRAALPEVTRRWGTLRRPVRIEVLPSHEALEAAVERPGWSWLRAWARYEGIWLQAPSTWGLFAGTDAALHELLVHELTHVAMYQRAARAEDWQRRRIPLWFREGMASVTARQGYRRADLEELSDWLRRNPKPDPLTAPDELTKESSAAVYATAHHAFAFLEARYGAAGVKAVLDRMQQDGAAFPDAFQLALGLPLARFEAEFRRYVLWEGWRRPGLSAASPTGSGGAAGARSPSPSAAARAR